MIEKTASLEDYIRNEVYELCGNEETKQLFLENSCKLLDKNLILPLISCRKHAPNNLDFV